MLGGGALNFPECERRGVLIQTEGGERVNINNLFAAFTADERRRWERWSGTVSTDEFGILPEGVERFWKCTASKS